MSLNNVLAVVTLTLALLAALAGTPHKHEARVESVAKFIATGRDHITAVELAERLMTGWEVRIVDVRDSSSYAQQHIPHAERMQLEDLLAGTLKRNEVTVLYSQGGTHAAQAWALLKMMHFDSIYTLLGGFEAWRAEVLYPELEIGTTPAEQILNERRTRISLHFGGEPRAKTAPPPPPEAKSNPKKNRLPTSPAKPAQEEEPLRFRC